MNVFVAGVHGVGKTYLALQIPASLSLTHTSASELIKEERGMASWDVAKKVSDVDVNQQALAAAVERRNGTGEGLLLDGHFVLLDSRGHFLRLGTKVFASLNLNGVVLLEADPGTIAKRIGSRDGRIASVDQVAGFLSAEREQADLVCGSLRIPLIILNSPSVETFTTAVAEMVMRS